MTIQTKVQIWSCGQSQQLRHLLKVQKVNIVFRDHEGYE